MPYTRGWVFGALLDVHNLRYNSGVLVLFHAQTHPTSPNFFENGFGLLPWHAFRAWISYSSFMLMFRLLTHKMSFFICSSYLVTLTNQGQPSYLLDADDVGFFPCAVVAIGFSGEILLLVNIV